MLSWLEKHPWERREGLAEQRRMGVNGVRDLVATLAEQC